MGKIIKKKTGFTLIEVIVVIGAIAITLPVLFNIIFTLLREQIKLYRLTEAKRQGDYALSLIETNIRTSATNIYNGTNTVEICNTTGSNAPVGYFRNSRGDAFRYILTGNRISSESAVPGATVDLTNNSVQISALTMNCVRTATYSTPIVDLQYTVTAGSGRQEERAQIVYRTRIKLRSY